MMLTEFLAYLETEPDWSGRGCVGIATRGVSGDTPLHAALWAGDEEAVSALLDAGADVDAKGEEGYTPLHVALARKLPSLVHHLVARGASWDTISEMGCSPRQTALASDSPEIRALAAVME